MDATTREEAVYRRVTWRLVPFLFLCYVCSYLDRVNVGFAKLQMAGDLGLSDAVYGVGAGIFFLGYFVFEVPSNLLLQRLGARIWIARIMIVWGLVSASTMLVHSQASFYALRFLLGVAEAGFFPGVILYLTYWYAHDRRARMVATFMTAVAVSGILGGPLSGWILGALDGARGLRGWQWLFLLEGLPSIAVGLLVFLLLDDSPEKARWLGPEEREIVLARLAEERRAKQEHADHAGHRFRDAFRSSAVWGFCLVYFGAVMGLYGVSFWLPQIIEDLGVADPFAIGIVSAIPWAAAALGMVAVGRHSDRTGERRWHVGLSALAAAAGFLLSGLFDGQAVPALAALTLATVGIMATVSSFWTLPTRILSGTAAAAGIAWINSVGNLAGQVGPAVVGYVRDATGSTVLGLDALALSLTVSGLLVLRLARPSPLARLAAPAAAPEVE